MNRNDTRYGPGNVHAERPRLEQDRDEWVLDEAIKESFPASDTPSPLRPGSLVGSSDARRRHKARAYATRQMVYLVVLGTIATIALVGRGRRRGFQFRAAAASSRWPGRATRAEAAPHE